MIYEATAYLKYSNPFRSVTFILKLIDALRQSLITAQQPYPYLKNPVEYPVALHLGDDGCKLCENIAQGIDALNHPEVASNVVIDLSDSYIFS